MSCHSLGIDHARDSLQLGYAPDRFTVTDLTRGRLRLPVQLDNPFSRLAPAWLAAVAMSAVWVVDVQAVQQIADSTSQVHIPPRKIWVLSPKRCRVPCGTVVLANATQLPRPRAKRY